MLCVSIFFVKSFYLFKPTIFRSSCFVNVTYYRSKSQLCVDLIFRKWKRGGYFEQLCSSSFLNQKQVAKSFEQFQKNGTLPWMQLCFVAIVLIEQVALHKRGGGLKFYVSLNIKKVAAVWILVNLLFTTKIRAKPDCLFLFKFVCSQCRDKQV